MSNSSRIEAATRQHVGATLTSEQIVELVTVSNPNWKGGVYPSDAAYKRTEEGLVARGKQSYGDGVLEYLGANSFKVLPTEQIIRRKMPTAAPVPTAPAKTPPQPTVASAPKAKDQWTEPVKQKPAKRRKTA